MKDHVNRGEKMTTQDQLDRDKYFIFRIHTLFSKTQSFDVFSNPPSRSELILSALKEILSSPRIEKTMGWQIAELKQIDKNGIYFMLAKVKSKNFPKIKSGHVEQVDFEYNPFVNCFVDLQLQICGITHNRELCAKPKTSAARLSMLLNQTDAFHLNGAEATIYLIPDPTDFIEALRKSYAIKRFSFTFKAPNPPDEDAMISEPYQQTLVKLDAKAGRADFSGESLDLKCVSAFARARIAVSDNVSAWVLEQAEDKKRKFIEVKKNIATVILSRVIEPTASVLIEVINGLRDAYEHIRKGDTNDEE